MINKQVKLITKEVGDYPTLSCFKWRWSFPADTL